MEEENNDQSYDSDESDDYNYMEPEYDMEGERNVTLDFVIYAFTSASDPPCSSMILRSFLLPFLIIYRVLFFIRYNPLDSCCEICYTVPSNKTDNPVNIFNESDLQLLHSPTPSKQGNSKNCTSSFPSDITPFSSSHSSSSSSSPTTATAAATTTTTNNNNNNIYNTVLDVWSDNPHDKSCDFLTSIKMNGLYGLSCGHRFCPDCWRSYLTIKIEEGSSIEIKCMSVGCNVLVIEDFLLTLLKNPTIKDKYLNLLFQRMVEVRHFIILFLTVNMIPGRVRVDLSDL
ncbi:unnamed protein product [Schistosoma margrebowiei]|uniref:RBR-type E3 ubiquitin transferase n=1 Tax=Schistosoma margrebowiei TaxID=48269 RepID=A0A183MN98_9TREM|nr:unnamed protein product [Schistosoma margrebowiei]